jgi:hypothetical protein
MAVIPIETYMDFCYLILPIKFSLLPLLCPSNQTPEQCLPSDHCSLGCVHSCQPASLCIWATQHLFRHNQKLGIHCRFHLTDFKNWSYRKTHCEATCLLIHCLVTEPQCRTRLIWNSVCCCHVIWIQFTTGLLKIHFNIILWTLFSLPSSYVAWWLYNNIPYAYLVHLSTSLTLFYLTSFTATHKIPNV